jgi:hypothetical protein
LRLQHMTPYIFRNLGEILPVTMIRVKSLM